MPSFAALARVQDKVAAATTLAELDVPQPAWTLATDHATVLAVDDLRAFVKTPIGTAGSGVSHVADRAALVDAAAHLASAEAFAEGPVVVQRAADGQLVILQSVFRAVS